MTSILIIAAERGLGLGLAREFFQRGWSVTVTYRPGADPDNLHAVGEADPTRLAVEQVDIADPTSVDGLVTALGTRRFDVIYQNAGIWGPMHQSVLKVTPEEIAQLFLTNAVAPARIMRRLLGHLPEKGGTLVFMSSLRGSVAENVEGGIELYRASKAALNSLTRTLWTEVKDDARTMLTIHPGWVNTEMGTLGGTVAYEIELDESVKGVAAVVARHVNDREHLFLDWEDRPIAW
ncbi:SDR family oxidoreductase [Marinivivus vitaminiproducens]|uniref:SDR family oxidoreductase n=1 Tax=Marinivivus vitaminiproducens TaxID=3035935 RepID=UPI0027AAC980|nr:SDR family oxidoreductase [Geminicoccaceae bacterium SCSIO 64248]